MLEANKRRNRAAGHRRWSWEGIKAHEGMRGDNASLGREQKPHALDLGLTMLCVLRLFSFLVRDGRYYFRQFSNIRKNENQSK